MKTFDNIYAAAFIICIILTFTSCGYHFGPGHENIDRSIQAVFIDIFQNDTSEAHLETYMRKAFIDELIQRGHFKSANQRSVADAILGGKIKTFTVSPIAYRSNNKAAVERIHITMEVFFVEQKTQKIIWRDHRFSGMVDYGIDATNLMVTKNARKNALIKLSNDSAERAFLLILSGF
ncbi:MAG: hypothetical protein JXA41_07895 [Deltaproteobacteria bacterium]|nr:hypothetical protein [Deltaproteobacteria bacterium]